MPGLFLIDTSALARSTHPEVSRALADCIADGVAARCVTVDLEAGYSGRNAQQVRQIEQQRRDLYRLLPINEQAADRAREVQILLAQAGHHRAAGVVDLLTAAIAEHHGATVLHYDTDFEHIATVTGQPHRWVVERGTID